MAASRGIEPYPDPALSRVDQTPDTGSTDAPDRAPTRAPLENIANRVARGVDYRAERGAARGVLWHESSLKRVRSCGRHSILSDGSVQVRARDGVAGFAGLATCGSVWVCPVCNARVQAVRRLEVETAVAVTQGEGGSAAFGAYTLRHHAGSKLDPLWRSLSKCWQGVARDKGVRQTRQRLGQIGLIRAAEVTYGESGPHPHLHPLPLFEGQVTEADIAELHAVEFRAWVAAADRLGLSAPVLAGQDLHLVKGSADKALGEYLSKSVYAPERVGWEMTSTQTKSDARATQSRTPWQVLDSVRGDGDADDLDLWHSWERDSKGKRALTWSRGLRARLGLDAEKTDEEIAAEEVGSEHDVGLVVTDWSPVRANPRLGAGLLAVVDGGKNWRGAREYCDRNGIEWRAER